MSVVIPYLREPDMLEACLAALAAQTWKNLEVIVVDNGSGDPALKGLWSSSYRVLRNLRNEGFARAANQGYAEARGEFLAVLNADAILEPEYIQRCVETLGVYEATAAVSGKLLKLGDRSLFDSTGHILFGDRRVKDRGEWEEDDGRYDRDQQVFSVPATAAVYLIRALENVEAATGEVFDEDLFAYWEDVDLAWRLRLQGWEVRYVPGAVARHRRAVSGNKAPGAVVVWDWRNRLLGMVKNDAPQSLVRHGWEVLFTEARLFVYFLLHRPSVPFRAWWGFLVRLPRALRKRRRVQASRKIGWRELEPWFIRYDYWAFLRRIKPG